MSQVPTSSIPIIVPLVVAGAFLGSVWSSKDLTAHWKKALLAATVSGLLNSGYVWLIGLLKAPVALGGALGPGASAPAQNDLVFISTCGIAAFLIVVTVYVSAIVMIRYRRGKEIEPEE